MNYRNSLFFASLVALQLASSAFAGLGAEGSGGGNGLHSTPAQVADFLTRNLTWGYEDGILEEIYAELQTGAFLPIQDPHAKAMLTRIMALKNVVTCDAQAGQEKSCQTFFDTRSDTLPAAFNLKMTGACVENGLERDASVTFHPNAQGQPVVDSICLSAERLAVYPPEALGKQVQALLLHEFSHVAGYGEDDAVYLQNYAVNKLLNDCQIRVNTNDSDALGDDWFEITIQGGMVPTVVHTRRYTQGREVILNCDNYNFPTPFPFHFQTGPNGGSIQFDSMNPDGSQAGNQLTWGPVAQSVPTLSSSASYNGKSISLTLDSIGKSCQR